MNFRTTLILALLVIGAAVAVVFIQRQGGGPPEEATLTTEPVYPGLRVDEINRIEITRPAEKTRLTFEKVDGQWQIVEPIQARADWHEVQALATKLSSMAYGRSMKLTSADAAEFGLQPPQATIRFTAGNTAYELLVGTMGGLGTDRFTHVRKAGGDRVFQAKTDLSAAVSADIKTFRAKQLVDWLPGEITEVTVRHDDQTVSAHRDGNQWLLTEPTRARADKQKIDDLVRAATGLDADTFVTDQPGGAAKYGFDSPQLAVTLQKPGKGKDAEPVSVTVTVGQWQDLQKTRAFARVSGSPAVVTVAKSQFDPLRKDTSDLRDRHVAPVRKADVTYMAIDLGDNAVAVERVTQDKWRIATPVKAPADADEVDSLLDRLANLTFTGFVDDAEPTSTKYGFDQPYGTITFRHAGDTHDTTIRLGKGPDGGLYAIETTSGAAGRVDASAVNKLRTSWLDLRDRTIWDIPADVAIRSVSWTRDGTTVTVTSSGGATPTYSLTSPTEEELDAKKAGDLFDAVRKLEAAKLLAPAADAAKYGLDSPSLTLTVVAGGEGEKETRHVLHIAESDGKTVGLAEQGTVVFEIPAKLMEKLQTPMDKTTWFAFDRDRVHRLEVTGPDWKLGFNRTDNEWTADLGENFPVDSMRVRWFVGDLASAKASKIVAYAAKNLAKYGLDKPQWRIHVKGLGVDQTALISATGIGDGRYATIEGSGRVVVLENSQVSRLTKDKSYFRKKS